MQDHVESAHSKVSALLKVFQLTEQHKLNCNESNLKKASIESPVVSAFVEEQGQYQIENGEKRMTEMDKKPPESVKHPVKEWNDLKNFVILGERVNYGNGHKKQK